MNRKISENEIYQDIDLKEIYGREPTTTERLNFADRAINRIIERTQDGKDINGRDFKDYTPEYAEFKGTSVGNVDLTFFGDMLLSLNPNSTSNGVRISVGDNETGKAHGNITGSYGQPSPNPSKARDFFGLKDSEVSSIAREVKESSAQDVIDGISISSLFQERQESQLNDLINNLGLFIDNG